MSEIRINKTDEAQKHILSSLSSGAFPSLKSNLMAFFQIFLLFPQKNPREK